MPVGEILGSEAAVFKQLRLLRNLLLFALLAFGMTAPATAWNVHMGSHASNPVTVDEHHHHDEGVNSPAHGHDAPDPGEPDSGHDHMPSLSAALAAIVDGAAAMVPAPMIVAPQPPYAASVLVDLVEPPPARPPQAI